MKEESNIREKLINRIRHLSDDEVNKIENYLGQLETKDRSKTEILSFSGIFKNLDQETMDDLTINLPERRLKGTSRIYY